ncbi:hypothetical protein ACHAXT_005766 [Thalassiosira profunda]
MTEINNGKQNKPGSGGRSLLDYSLVACFALILLLGIVVLDAFEYISVPGLGGAKGAAHTALEAGADIDILSNEELKELQKQVDDAKKVLADKKSEVEKLVDKVEDEIKKEEPAHVETAEEKKEEEKKVEAVVAAVVEAEVGIDKFCPSKQYGMMPFNCGARLAYMMDNYGLTEDMGKMAIIHKCHCRRRLRGLN